MPTTFPADRPDEATGLDREHHDITVQDAHGNSWKASITAFRDGHRYAWTWTARREQTPPRSSESFRLFGSPAAALDSGIADCRLRMALVR